MRSLADRYLKGDPVIWVVACVLSLASILVVYSATGSLAYRRMGGNTEYYLLKHSLLTLLSLVLMWVTHRIDYRYYYTFSKLALWISLPLLLLTLRFGERINEATRWIMIPFIEQSFQPADFARLALFVYVAGVLAKHQRDERELKAAMVPILFWSASICGIIAVSDFSSAVLIAATTLLMMFVGRVPFRYLSMLCMVLVLSGGAAVLTGERGGTVLRRVEQFVKEDDAYQTKQAYVAIASGGLLGKGPGKSSQRNFLPHAYSDFIYAIVLEEYGLLGGLLILLLYVVLLYRGSKVLLQTNRVFGGLLSASLCMAIAAQALVNMAVAVGLLPVTGLPLPLISMGGTSQLFMGMSLGIVLSVSRQDASTAVCEEDEEDEEEGNEEDEEERNEEDEEEGNEEDEEEGNEEDEEEGNEEDEEDESEDDGMGS